jgi:phage N-6-adenine-methyltransferase
MNELTVINTQLPDTLEDLSKFVLIGRDKLQAVRAEISAISKLGLAKEVYEQKKAEAQEIAETVTLAEMRTGELLKAIPKASGGDRKSDNFKKPIGGQFEKTVQDTIPATKPKAEVIKELGFDRHQAQRMEKLAENPDIVHKAIEEARQNDDIVSRAFVLEKIKEAKMPHVSFNSGNNEWYTPEEYIKAARQVLGVIDLDPATSQKANEVVKAENIYTIEDNGLEKEWFGNVWLNPPYSSDLIGKFAEKVKAKEYKQAIVLVNNATETSWFYDIVSVASAVVFPTHRVKFYKPDGTIGAPLQGQAFLYIGENPTKFLNVFGRFGWGALHELHRC